MPFTSRKKLLPLLLLLTLLSPTPLTLAAEPPAPAAPMEAVDIVEAGLREYQGRGAAEAIRVWVKNSALEESKEVLGQAAEFQQIETFYGALKGFEVLKVQEVAATSKLVYVSMNYEKGPVFARFLGYRGIKGWTLVNFDFNTKPELVLPYLLLQ